MDASMTDPFVGPEPDDAAEPPVVAFLTHSAQLSGAELFLLRVTRAFQVVHPVVVLGEQGPLAAALQDAGVECVVLPLSPVALQHGSRTRSLSLGTLRKVAGVVSTARAVARLCRARGVRLVTTHSAKAHVYGGIAARLTGTPCVAHLHSVIGAGGGRRSNSRLLRFAATSLPTALIANSRATATSVGRFRGPVDVVGCPVDLPATVPDEPAEPTVTVIGRLAAVKGQDVVLRAFAAARAARPCSSARLRVVGDALFEPDREFARSLPVLAAELGIGDAVDFVGHSTDVAGELARASVVVQASRVPEGFGQTVVEAMAAGRVVIASACGGPAELVTDGLDGVLVPPSDVDALAHALVAVLGDARRRAAMGVRARAAARRHEAQVVVDELERALLAHVR